MLINGDTTKLKVTNPVSDYKKQKAVPSFSGHTFLQDAHGEDIYKFYLPNKPKNAKVELVVLQRKNDGNFEIISKKPERRDLPQEGLIIKADTFLGDKKNQAIGYRFYLNNSDVAYYDYTAKNAYDSGEMYNVATPAYRAGHMLPRQMQHVYPDSTVLELINEKRNHFSHLGGNIQSMIELIDNFKDFGVSRILGTPVFGQDTISSHGYWSSNAYQVTDTMGDLSDFKHLQIKLFQNGMGWVSDGAFVNEGLQGIHIKDLLAWGEDTPFINWFDTSNVKDNGVKLGILSKQPQTNKHVRYKLINAPYKIEFVPTRGGIEVKSDDENQDYDGFKEKRVAKHSYDPTQPTYLQLFDERLVTKEQVESDEPFKVYARKNAPDKHEINNYKDSVQPYSFRVTPKDVRKNYEKYEEVVKLDKKEKSKAPKPEFKSFLTKWSNFEITPSNEDAGMTLWVGNSDIAKKRFMTPEGALKNLPPDKRDEVRAAQYQVQDDTVQIGKYWTSEVARTLLAYTSELIGKKASQGLSYEQAVKELIKEKKLPKKTELIFEKINGSTPFENILKANTNGERAYKLKPVVKPENVTDGLMAYPFETIEFNPDFTTVLAYPFLKNFAVDKDSVGLSRFELYKQGDSFYNKMPERFKEIYKNTDAFIAGSKDVPLKDSITGQAIEILKAVGDNLGFEITDSEGNLTTEGKEIYSIFAADIAKFLYVSVINPKIKPQYHTGVDEEKEFSYNNKDLQKVSIESLNLQYSNSPDETAKNLLKLMKENIKEIPFDTKKEFINYLTEKVENIDADTINIARLILEKTESGLDWRIDASKDVGDWDSVSANLYDEKECFERLTEFWTHFNKGVRQYNPKSYTIGEFILDMKYPHDPKVWESIGSTFNNRTSFTTQSDYGFLFSGPLSLYGTETESNNHQSGSIVDFTKGLLTDRNPGMLFSGLLDNVNFAHTFSGNHDKPRLLHTLSVDMGKFTLDKSKAVLDLFNYAFDTPEFSNLMGDYKNILKKTAEELSKGNYIYHEKNKKFDSEDFGCRPFDENINDIIDQASQKDGDFSRFMAENPGTIAAAKAKLLELMLKPALTKYTSALFYMVGMPGNPTVYAGDELGETGWETLAKNEKQQNRSRLHYERLNDPNYKYIKQYRDNLAAIMNIRNQKAASPLVNGNTILLAGQSLNGGGCAAAIYRYNDKTDAVCVFHNDGYGASRLYTGNDKSLREIVLDQLDDKQGLPNGLEVGARYYDALNPSNKYEVVKDSITGQFKIINTIHGADILLGNRGIILLREKSFDNENYLNNDNGKISPSFRGKNINPYVKLANTKYPMLSSTN